MSLPRVISGVQIVRSPDAPWGAGGVKIHQNVENFDFFRVPPGHHNGPQQVSNGPGNKFFCIPMVVFGTRLAPAAPGPTSKLPLGPEFIFAVRRRKASQRAARIAETAGIRLTESRFWWWWLGGRGGARVSKSATISIFLNFQGTTKTS